MLGGGFCVGVGGRRTSFTRYEVTSTLLEQTAIFVRSMSLMTAGRVPSSLAGGAPGAFLGPAPSARRVGLGSAQAFQSGGLFAGLGPRFAPQGIQRGKRRSFVGARGFLDADRERFH